MKILKRILTYTLCNGLFVGMLWCGTVENIQGCANVALFIAWVTGITSVLACTDAMLEYRRKRGPSPIPIWFDQSFDVVVTLFMAYHSWWWTAAIYFFHMLMLAASHDQLEKLVAKDLPPKE